MMDDRNPEPVTWAEVGVALRKRSGWSYLASLLWVAGFVVSLHQLRAPDLTVMARLLWCGAPLPFMGLTLWGILRRAAHQTELERRLTEQAASITFALTIAFYFTLGLVNMAFPIRAENLAWSWFWPFLTFTISHSLLFRRYNAR